MQKYQDVVLDRQGNVVTGASVTVYLGGTTTKATIYSDNGITVAANPALTDSLGRFSFYVADGRYDLLISALFGGVQVTQNVSDVLADDPAEGAVGAHASTHKSGGVDAIKLDEFAAPTDVTTLNADSTKHGLLPKTPADATKFLNGAATPAYAQVKDSDLITTDITTNDVTSTKHGLAPKSLADATKFLNSAATPVYAQVKDSDLITTDVTTNNSSSTKHGFVLKSPADATQFLNGAATPAYAAVKDSDLATTDVTTNNVTTAKHGFAPKAPNDITKFLDGTGAYSVPAGSAGGFPAGTVMLFKQTAAPTGWTKDTTAALNDTCLRIVTGTVGSGGVTAFSSVFGASKVTGAHTLTTAEQAAHSHTPEFGSAFITGGTGGSAIGPSGGIGIDNNTSSSGGGGSHTHTLSLDLKFNDVIIASKD